MISLAQAREAALENRKALAQGRDPRDRSGGIPTSEEAVDKVIAIHEPTWKDGARIGRDLGSAAVSILGGGDSEMPFRPFAKRAAICRCPSLPDALRGPLCWDSRQHLRLGRIEDHPRASDDPARRQRGMTGLTVGAMRVEQRGP